MQRLSLQQLPLSQGTKQRLLDDRGVAGAVLYTDQSADQNERVAVFGPGCASRTLDDTLRQVDAALGFWERGVAPHAVAERGRTAVALHMLAECPGLPPYTAAKTAGVDVSAVYRAIKREQAKQARPVCQCCGRPLETSL